MVPRITKEWLVAQLDGNSPPLILDARLKYPYEHSSVTLPNAIRYEEGAPFPPLPAGRTVVVYDSDPDELTGARVAAMLIRTGVRAAALQGGIADWVDAKLPVQTKAVPVQTTMRRAATNV